LVLPTIICRATDFQNLHDTDGRVAQKVCHLISRALLVFNNQMKLLYISGPLQMVLLLNLGLRIDKNKGIVVGMQDRFLTQDIMSPLLEGLN